MSPKMSEYVCDDPISISPGGSNVTVVMSAFLLIVAVEVTSDPSKINFTELCTTAVLKSSMVKLNCASRFTA